MSIQYLIQYVPDQEMRCNLIIGKMAFHGYFLNFYSKLVSVTRYLILKIVSKYNQEISQSQTADNPMAPRGRATQPSRDTRKIN